jgi:3-oxoacyl-[acyl-carrier protein] reductase
VHFASNVVSFGMANFLHYVASKSAIIGMTRSLARELGPDHIRVNSVSPGFIETEVTERERDPDYRAALVSRQCIPVPMTPEDVCSTVLFLISPGARAMTGENILINSGTHMGPA